ncbi:MAG: AraC family transcriptional regulator [Acidobacteriia bacterium]|nr:AraC family transcriptional regulator [Terriglobia bacterium]
MRRQIVPKSVDTLAREHGIARRTLERRFREETGMSFAMWRQKARLLDSIRLLADSAIACPDCATDQSRRGRGNGLCRYRRLGPSRQRIRPARVGRPNCQSAARKGARFMANGRALKRSSAILM